MMEACWQNGMRCLRDMSLRSATCPLLMQVASWNIMVQVDWVMVGQAGHVRGAKAPSLGCQKKCGVIEIFVFGIVVTANTSATWGWLRLMFLAWVHTYGLFGKGHLRQMTFGSLWAVWDLYEGVTLLRLHFKHLVFYVRLGIRDFDRTKNDVYAV